MWEVFTTEQELILIAQKKKSEAKLSFPCLFNGSVLFDGQKKKKNTWVSDWEEQIYLDGNEED